MPKELTRYDVELWIKIMATGEFHYKQVLDGTVDPASFGKLRKIMFDICHAKEPVCEPCGKKDGYYRPIQDLPQPVLWQDGENRIDSGIILPFGLRDYVFIYPNTIIIVAGSKSSGKTGFLYRTLEMNMTHKNINLLTNLEGGTAQLRDRLAAMNVPNPAPFKVYQVTENFHDYIKFPDTLYIIDYIDVPEGAEFYLIAALVGKIQKKIARLVNSNAIIGLQKPPSRDIAYGGATTLKDATLYLAMDKNKLKIVDAKVPVNPTLIPNNMTWRFRYYDLGTRFEEISKEYGIEES